MTSLRDSVNVEPDLSTDPNRVQPLYPGIGDNIVQPKSVGDTPSFEFDTAQSAEETQEQENDPNQRPLSAAERRRNIRRNKSPQRVSDQPTAAERKRNFRRRNQPTGSAVTESIGRRKNRYRGG